MERSLYKLGESCVFRACALVGAAVIAVSAVPQHAAAQVTQEWFDREFQAGVFGVDNAVDIAYWKDSATNEEWVYVTGYQTVANGATVFATSKYLATFTGPGENNPFIPTVFYPPDPARAMGTNRAVGIEVDEDGNVYVTGASSDPTGADGLDYVIIKYNKDLVPHTDWVNAGHSDAVVRWDNPTFAGTTSHDRPVDIALGRAIVGNPPKENVIGITGRSDGGVAQDDIVTVLLSANTGNPYVGWTDVGWGPGVRAFNGGTNNDDSAVALDVLWVVPEGEGNALPNTFVAGTTRYPLPHGDDIVTMRYDPSGNRSGPEGWTNEYQGPTAGDDVATAMRWQRR